MRATSPRSCPGRRTRISRRASAIGFQVIIFLIGFSLLLYFVKKKVWKDIGSEFEAQPPVLPRP